MDPLTTSRGSYTISRATRDDVPEIMALLRDDEIGATREGSDPTPYLAAFAEVDGDPHQLLAIARDEGGAAAATLQLTFVPGLTRGGATRMIIEGVRVHAGARSSGLGTALMGWAHGQGRSRGATLAQLTSDRTRTDAHRFYERLGYLHSHEGYKLELGG